MPDIPLAYLITVRCYGTWLHGDERGSSDRLRNQYGTPFVEPNDRWRSYNQRKLKHAPVNLDEAQRRSVERAIRDTCRFRNWTIGAINVRTNHVHVLVATNSGSSEPEPPPSTQPSAVPSPVAERAAQSVPSPVGDGSVSGSTTAVPRLIVPERVIKAFKANATRQMRQDGHWRHQHSPWSDGGSRRYIWTEVGIERAMDYVINGQGGPIPELDQPRPRGRTADAPIAYGDGTDCAARLLPTRPSRSASGTDCTKSRSTADAPIAYRRRY